MATKKLFAAFFIFTLASALLLGVSSAVRAEGVSAFVEVGNHFSEAPANYVSAGVMNTDFLTPGEEGTRFIFGLGATRDHFLLKEGKVISALALEGKIGMSIPIDFEWIKKKGLQALEIAAVGSIGEATRSMPFSKEKEISHFRGHRLSVTWRVGFLGIGLRGPGVFVARDDTVSVPPVLTLSVYAPWPD